MKNSRLYFSFFIAILVISVLVSFNIPEHKNDSPIVIMGYYVPEKSYQPEQLPLNQLTHIIYSFTNIIDGEMKFRDKKTGEKLKQLVTQRKKHPHLKVMIACGGWGADGFSDMAHTKENRDKFVKSVVDFNTEYELDGLDMDWEYPSIPAAGTGARRQEEFYTVNERTQGGTKHFEKTTSINFCISWLETVL